MAGDELELSVRGGGVRLSVHVKPRSSKSKIVGVKEGALVVALRSPPVEGAANEELILVLAHALGIRRGDVTIASGAGSRRKLVDVCGIGAQQVRLKLEGLE